MVINACEKGRKCTLGSCKVFMTNKIGHVLHRLQKVGKSLHTQTLLGRDRHAKAPAKLKAFWPEQEQVTGMFSIMSMLHIFSFSYY